jgi:hypothetical protein
LSAGAGLFWSVSAFGLMMIYLLLFRQWHTWAKWRKGHPVACVNM